MESINWQAWRWQYGTPLLVLARALPITGMFRDDPDLLWGLVIAPLVMFISGCLFRPVHTLIVPVIAVISLSVAAAFANPHRMPGLILNIVVFIGLPMLFLSWAGPEIHAWLDNRHRRDTAGTVA